MEQGEKISMTVVTEIADREGVDPTELAPPLFEVIDLDALDTLFRSTEPGEPISEIQFTYKNYTVVADSTGTVRVRDSGDSSPSESATTD